MSTLPATRPSPLGLRLLLLGLPLALAACSGPVAPIAAGQKGSLEEASLAPTLCGGVQDMYVVAHQDDDLLFMNPDLSAALRAGHCIFTVYLTTGDNPPGVANYNAAYGTKVTAAEYAQQREAGMLAAYAQMAGVSNAWQRGTMRTSTGKTVATATLLGNSRIVLAFMRLPEAADRSVSSSVVTLDDLYFGLAPLTTSSDGVRYTREELIATLADLMNLAQPKYLHFQDSDPDPFIRDVDGNVMSDHTDHIIGARFAQAADRRYLPPHTRIRYRDYNINAENLPNLSAAEVAAKSSTFGVYAQHDMLICPPATDCTNVALFPQWMGADYQGWLKRQYFNIADDQGGSVLRNGQGLLQAFMTGDRTSTIRTLRQSAAGGSSFGAWSDLGGNFSAQPVVAAYADGRLAAFVHSNIGTMLYSFQTAVGGPWTSWRSLGGSGVSDAAVTLNRKSGAMQLFVVSSGGEILVSTDKTGNGGWSAFASLSGRFPGFEVWSNPSAALLPSGRTSLFVRDNGGNIRYTTQVGSGRAWKKWISLGEGFQSDPVAVANTNGRLDLFMRGNDNQLYTRQQDDQDVWTPWRKLEFGTMQFMGEPVVATAPGGRTEVFVRDLDTSIVRFTRPSPSGSWSTPERLPTQARAMSIIGVDFDGSGTLNVVIRGTDGQVYTTSTRSVAGGWTPWVNLGN